MTYTAIQALKDDILRERAMTHAIMSNWDAEYEKDPAGIETRYDELDGQLITDEITLRNAFLDRASTFLDPATALDFRMDAIGLHAKFVELALRVEKGFWTGRSRQYEALWQAAMQRLVG